MDTTDIIISLGSNSCNKQEFIKKAISEISKFLTDASVSNIYETSPLSGTGGMYANAVIAGKTNLSCDSLSDIFKKMEIYAGRTPEARKNNHVPLDIDIVIYDGVIIRPADFSRGYFRKGYEELVKLTTH